LLIVDDDDCKKLRKLKVSSPFKKRCLSPKLARLKIQKHHAQNNTVAYNSSKQETSNDSKSKSKSKAAKQQSSLYFFV
jgi:hypothetical protein